MATEKEKALLRELIDLALEVNEQGVFDAHAEVSAGAVNFRISPKPFYGSWEFYGEDTAYFSGGAFDEAYFAKRIGVFIDAAKQHHKAYRVEEVAE